MSSHARIEGVHTVSRGIAAAASGRADLPDARSPRSRRKTFLPQLGQAKAFVLSSRRDVPHLSVDGTMIRPMDADTDAFKQAMWEGQANILVTVRLRPRLGHERDHDEIVKALDHNLVVVLDSTTAGGSEPGGPHSPVRRHTSHPMRKIRQAAVSSAPQRRSREKRFAFDYVFSPDDNQQTVYCRTTKFLIHGVLNGFNATVFAYGCTGAGKTYTMLGTPDQPGIMALTLEDLFQNIARVHADPLANTAYKVTVSFLEVYNENLRDLLAPSSSSSASPASSEFLDLREDPVKGPVIAGISEIEACNALEVMKLLRKGNKNRSQEATAANAVSSRSHAVLQVLVEQREKTSSAPPTGLETERAEDSAVTSVVKFGKLSLVDLAGSERAAVTQNRGQRLLEGANINRSLLALGNCINALSEKGASAATFVPYRDSKLTRLLKDSLGGNCRTVMIANVSLAAASFEETLNTLKYANRAKNIKTTVSRNVLSVDHHITEYVGVISGLRDEVAALKRQLVRQQQLDVGPAATLRRSTNNNNNNDEDDDEHDEHATAVATGAAGAAGRLSAEAIQARLQDVRQHIARYFAERLKLREALLRLDFQVGAMNGAAEGEETDKSSTTSVSPEITNTASLEKNQQETVAAAPRTPEASSPETPLAAPSSRINASETRRREELEALAARRKTVAQELARLEIRMEDFRAAILESSTLMDHELFREVLVMEYRVGGLEGDKMELQVAKELRDLEIDAMLKRRTSAGGRGLQQFAGSSIVTLPQLSPTLDTANNVVDSGAAHSQRGSPRRFMDDLRDRFQTLTSSSRDGDAPKQSQRHPQSQAASYAHPTSSNARKQWGLSLTSSALPYIRVKKKDELSSLPPTGAGAGTSASASAASSSVSGPYLRVLKHRRKAQQHHGAKKPSKRPER